MRNISKIVTESVNGSKKNFVQEAVNKLLGEDITSGTKVAIIDDPITGYSGARGTVRTGGNESGIVPVELEGGTTVFCQSSLLIPV